MQRRSQLPSQETSCCEQHTDHVVNGNPPFTCFFSSLFSKERSFTFSDSFPLRFFFFILFNWCEQSSLLYYRFSGSPGVFAVSFPAGVQPTAEQKIFCYSATQFLYCVSGQDPCQVGHNLQPEIACASSQQAYLDVGLVSCAAFPARSACDSSCVSDDRSFTVKDNLFLSVFFFI